MSEDKPEEVNEADFDRRHRWALVRLLGRISLYYVIVFGLTVLLLNTYPQLKDQLPIGGIGQFSQSQDMSFRELGSVLSQGENGALEKTLAGKSAATAEVPSWIASVQSLLLAMIGTFILMIPVSWVYKTIHEGHDYDHSIDETALILPAVVAGIVTVVQHSLALAFSLAGIMAGVRFRRALSDTFDTLFIFVAIGVGLAAGIASIETAAAITVFFNYTTIAICIFGDGLESKYIKQRKDARKEEKLQQQVELQKLDKKNGN